MENERYAGMCNSHTILQHTAAERKWERLVWRCYVQKC